MPIKQSRLADEVHEYKSALKPHCLGFLVFEVAASHEHAAWRTVVYPIRMLCEGRLETASGRQQQARRTRCKTGTNDLQPSSRLLACAWLAPLLCHAPQLRRELWLCHGTLPSSWLLHPNAKRCWQPCRWGKQQASAGRGVGLEMKAPMPAYRKVGRLPASPADRLATTIGTRVAPSTNPESQLRTKQIHRKMRIY